MGHVSRRAMLAGAAMATVLKRPAIAQAVPLKVGVMLPFSGTYAALGENIAAQGNRVKVSVVELTAKFRDQPVENSSQPTKKHGNG
jgi:hypothetical protein